jgi:uncharacterized protein YajQ (UPF0234 family)
MSRKKRSIIRHDLVKWKKEHSADNYSTVKNESEHDIAFKKLFDILHNDLLRRSLVCNLAVEYFVDKTSGSKEQNLSNKEDIVNAFLFSKGHCAKCQIIF